MGKLAQAVPDVNSGRLCGIRQADIKPPDTMDVDRARIASMSTADATTHSPHDDTILATVARHRAMLGEMAEIALELARWFKDQVIRGLFKGRNPVAQLEMLGRTLRQILAMDELIAEDPLGIVKLFNNMIGRREAAERKAEAQSPAPEKTPAPAKSPSDAPPKPRAENLLGDLFDPLFQLRDKPIGEIIAGICHDLGVDPGRYQWDVVPEPAVPPVKPKPTAKTKRLFGSTAISPSTHLFPSFSSLKGGEGTHGTHRGPPLRP
jgi:hypothetical protein